ncbi:MAG: hypothetical protein ACTSX9_00725 [Candidatus Njordarchaeales archaeon]
MSLSIKSKKFVVAMFIVLQVLALVTMPSNVIAQEEQDVATFSNKLKDIYRQNEELHVIVVVRNDKQGATLRLDKFNLTIFRFEAGGERQTKFTVIIRELYGYALEGNASYTLSVKISLKNFPPGRYNITAYFEAYYFPGRYFEVYAIKSHEFQVLPSLEIPPAVLLVMGIMSGIILIYIGYGIAGRFKRS